MSDIAQISYSVLLEGIDIGFKNLISINFCMTFSKIFELNITNSIYSSIT